MNHHGNGAQSQREAGITLQTSSAMVFWAHFPTFVPSSGSF